jgi:hypothetical protein
MLLSASVTVSLTILSVQAVARVPLPLTIEKNMREQDIWIIGVICIIVHKRHMPALFIAAQKGLFAIPGCSVLCYIAASAMRTFYRC